MPSHGLARPGASALDPGCSNVVCQSPGSSAFLLGSPPIFLQLLTFPDIVRISLQLPVFPIASYLYRFKSHGELLVSHVSIRISSHLRVSLRISSHYMISPRISCLQRFIGSSTGPKPFKCGSLISWHFLISPRISSYFLATPDNS